MNARRKIVLMLSILLIDATSVLAQDEPGPFERFFRAMRHGFGEPRHKSAHRSNHKQQTVETESTAESKTQASGESTGKPPSDRNTRTTTRASTKKGEDLPYGTPVPGKQGFVTSPFSPNSGYIDVRGFAPGTPVKDPYTGKVFLTP